MDTFMVRAAGQLLGALARGVANFLTTLVSRTDTSTRLLESSAWDMVF